MLNQSKKSIKESLFRELMDLQVFWSYKKPDLYTLSDEILIEKVLLHSDLDSIYKLFDIFPAHDIGEGKISASLEMLFWELPASKLILIDGYAGTFFHEIIEQLSALYTASDLDVPEFIDISTSLKEEAEIITMLEGSMGGSDPIFGKRTKLSLIDFFDPRKLDSLNHRIKGKNVLVYGTGHHRSPPVVAIRR